VAWAHRYPAWGWLLPTLFGAAGAGLAVYLVNSLAPETAGSGIPHLKAILYRLRSLRWRRILPIKFFGGVFAIGSGLALGREGPTVQMGGAVGAAVAEWLKVTPRERQTLIAAGAGAGLAAAFLASTTADVVTQSLTNQLPVFHVAAHPAPSLVALPAFLVLGLVTK